MKYQENVSAKKRTEEEHDLQVTVLRSRWRNITEQKKKVFLL